MNSQKTYDRSGDEPRDSKMDSVIKGLIKHGLNNYQAMQEIKSLYKDDDKMRKTVMEAFENRLKYITKKATNFKRKVYTKLANVSADVRFIKAKKYAQKNKISDDEMNVFINMIFKDNTLESSFNNVPNTPIAKMLGFSQSVTSSDALDVSVSDMTHVNDIISMRAATTAVHSQVVLQSLTYKDCDLKAIHGSAGFTPYRKNIYNHVNPVVAALFLPRIKCLDENMLIANMGSIIEAKQRRTNISTQPDYELYQNLINDPTAFLCNDTSPIQDIKHRFYLQTKLWENVLNLRQGIFYDDRLNDLTVAINNCKNNLYDAPDLTYVQDEGTYLRRLLGAFGIRPTVISTSSAFGNQLFDPTGMQMNALSAAGISQLTTVPMITVRLPINFNDNNSAPISILDAMSQTQWFKEGMTIVPKKQSVLHSRDCIFFYVSRRFQTISLTRTNMPCNFSKLPTTVGGWEALNQHVVDFPPETTIFNDVFDLRSVVLVETNPMRKNLIIGTTAAVIIPDYMNNMWGNTFDKAVLLYDPVGVGIQQIQADGQTITNNPITYIDYDTRLDTPLCESLCQRASTRGTIFMYQKRAEVDCNGQQTQVNPFVII